MTMKVKAIEKKLKFTKDPNDAGVYRYVMSPEQYSSLNQKKVIKEAALRSGVSQGVMQACWDAAGEVIKAWATEGHSVALPGLGTMRFGMGNRRPQRGSARTGNHAIRSAKQVCGGREQGEDRSDYQPSHHLHSRHRPEGRAEEHRHRHHLLRPQR